MNKTKIIFAVVIFMSIMIYGVSVVDAAACEFRSGVGVGIPGSNGSYLNGAMVPTGANISAYDPDGVLCGWVLIPLDGAYMLSCGDDDSNTPEDEGAVEGDIITFYINGIQAVVYNGNNTWTDGGTQLADLNATTPLVCLNLTPAQDNNYINEDTTLCPGTYNIADGSPSGVLIINASNIVLDCDGAILNGTGSGRGIYNYGYDNVTIKNCVVMNYEHGIYLNNAENTTLLNNTLRSNADKGIYLYRSNNCTLSNNTANSNGNGTYIYQSDFNKIENNKIENNTDHGIYIRDSSCESTKINQNRVCFNGATTDIYNNGTGSFGVNNTCDTTYNWNDTGATNCSWRCPIGVETATDTGVAYFSTKTITNGTIMNLIAVNESFLPSAGKPNIQFPHGFFSFNITGLSNNETVTLTIELPGTLPVGSQYWKYGPNCNNSGITGWYQIPMGDDDGDNIITINLTDGGIGDDNCTPDGKIFDAGGPGSPIWIESENCTYPSNGPGPREDIFNPYGPDVCAYGNATGTCDIWVCNDTTWSGSENLTVLGCENVITISGNFENVSVMSSSNPGEYDLVLDCNQNGIYETATDVLDDADIGGSSPGFYITSEPLAAVLFITGLSLLYGFARVKKS